MVDPLRHDLIQVVRKCPGIILEQPEINKILNGKYQQVIQEYKQENQNIEELAMPPAPEESKPVDQSEEILNDPENLEDEDQEILENPHDLEDK